jgi:hypothetical protein
MFRNQNTATISHDPNMWNLYTFFVREKVLNKSLIFGYAISKENEAYTLATPIPEVELHEHKDIVRI